MTVTDNKMRAKTNGAVPTLLTTLRNFPGHPDITLAVLKTIGNLVDLGECHVTLFVTGYSG